jgi:mannose-6-phosphate isomerase-like protein (cupin superfamily)
VSADHRFPLAEAIARLPPPADEQYVVPFRHGTLELGLYAPRGRDPQGPHTRDELYVIMRGSGWFVNGSARTRFAPGDVLFVPAGTVHRFEEFSDDFVAWVVFYGPEGGERPVGHA